MNKPLTPSGLLIMQPSKIENRVPIREEKFAFFLTFFIFSTVYAEEKYDLSLLENVGDVSKSDVSTFNNGNDVLPGEYTLSVIVNDNQFDDQAVIYKKTPNNKVNAVFSCEKLKQWRIVIEHCLKDSHEITDYIKEAKVDIDQGDNTLSITVPQKYYSTNRRIDIAEPIDWDNGINAAFSNYTVNTDSTRTQGSAAENSVYGNFINGINFGGFRLRNDGFFTKSSSSSARYTSSSNYLEHDIDLLRSEVSVGDFFTSGQLFAAQNLRGVSLTTNTAMLPYSELTYVPIISGTAKSNATIIIKQNGFVIATRKVPPGPFALTDIPASSSAGDLDISIVETGIGTRHIIQPYNTVNVLVPEHAFRYSLYTGRNRSILNSPQLIETNAIYGISNTITLLGGMQYTQNYRNTATGLGANVRWFGGVYATVNNSKSNGPYHVQHEGTMVKGGLSHSFSTTNSYLYITGEHRLTEGYTEFAESIADSNTNRYQSRYTLQLSQPIREINVSLNMTQQYGFNHEKSHSFGGGLSFNINKIQIMANASMQSGSQSDSTISLNISLPLDQGSRNYLNYAQSHSKSGGIDNRLSVSGSTLDDDSLSYDAGISSAENERQYDSSLNWVTSKGNVNASWNQSAQSNELTLGVSGAMVAHKHGLTLGQSLGQSNILVHTDHVSGLHVSNSPNISTDYFGNALITGVIPYHYNEVALSADGIKKQVEIDSNVYQSSPRSGAITEVSMQAYYKEVHYAHIEISDSPIAFGTIVYDAEGKKVGIASAGGLTALNLRGSHWPFHILNSDTRCSIELQDADKNANIWNLLCK